MIRQGLSFIMNRGYSTGLYGYKNKITYGEQFPQTPLTVPAPPAPPATYFSVKFIGI